MTRCALVTGVSRGIGRAIAHKLATAGYAIAGCSLGTDDRVRAADAEALRSAGTQVFLARCDVADLAGVEEFIVAAERALGPITTLVNNAGIVRDNPIVTMPPDDWNAVLSTNLTGTWNFCRAMSFRFIKRRAGTIVNVSSVAGLGGVAGQTNYAASKAGIIGMSNSLAKEVARFGIRVNVVAPGFIETDMTIQIPEPQRASFLRSIPLGRFGTADEVAELVEFLASDRARYITGQTFQVDGGIAL